ncbi:MAG: hypothetical protein E7627_07055 [Ruminococcaceae bacterium]|nr:hypothetical protein [Oscillospiraceae bacterium]
MNYLSWTADGVRIYLDEGTVFLTYDELMLYIVVIGLCVGLMIGVVVSYFTRINSHRAVKALIFDGCLSPDTAKTVGELNTRKKQQVKRIIKNGRHLDKVIICANIDDFPKESLKGFGKFWKKNILGKEPAVKLDFDRARFYIPEEKKIHAEVRYSNEGMSPAALVITLIVLAGVAVAALYLIPDLITMAENVFGK